MFKKRGIVILSLIAVIGGLIVFNGLQGVPVEVFQVSTGNIRQYVEDTAVVKSKKSRTIYLETSGRVAQVLVEAGDWVNQGDLLVRMDEIDLRVAEVAAQQARINSEQAARDWSKVQKLYEAGAISRTEWEQTKSAYETATAGLQGAELEQSKHKKSSLFQAPLSGIILERMVEPNLVAPSGTAIFVIGGLADLEVEAEILADEVVKVRLGNPVEVFGKAAGDAVLKGKVVKVAPMAKNVVSSLGVNQKRVPVTIQLTEGSGMLKPGYNVDLRIVTRERLNTIRVPLTAVFSYRDGEYVFVVEAGKARLRKVETGIENDEAIEILKGLEPGDLALVKPDNELKEAVRVKPKIIDL